MGGVPSGGLTASQHAAGQFNVNSTNLWTASASTIFFAPISPGLIIGDNFAPNFDPHSSPSTPSPPRCPSSRCRSPGRPSCGRGGGCPPSGRCLGRARCDAGRPGSSGSGSCPLPPAGRNATASEQSALPYAGISSPACAPKSCTTQTAERLVGKVHDWDPEGWWFKPRCSHDKIHAAVGPLNKALNPTLLQGGLYPA